MGPQNTPSLPVHNSRRWTAELMLNVRNVPHGIDFGTSRYRLQYRVVLVSTYSSKVTIWHENLETAAVQASPFHGW